MTDKLRDASREPEGAAKEPAARSSFPVVAVGASAGGLQALEVLFGGLGSATGAAFVIVTHMNPDHKSLLAEILARLTPMPVLEAREGMPLAPDTVFVIPPGRTMTVREGTLRLHERPSRANLHHPIDTFLSSLAADRDSDIFCVILSGAGSDGSAGLREIREAGGVTIVQDPASAAHAGMPQSALDTGLADLALPIDKIPDCLARHLRTAQDLDENRTALPDGDNIAEHTRQILGLLREASGHDFSSYKPSTIGRRIQKRMLLAGMLSLQGYAELVRNDEHERTALFHDLLIGVTRFFRDSEAFDSLRRLTLPALFRGKGEGDVVRVWVAGCSSGEEPYSLAILISEFLARSPLKPEVKIFATDIDKQAVETARRGVYDRSIEIDLPPALLEAYFSWNGKEHVVCPELREMIVFAPHDLLRDPPFFRLDLIVCRNLLIYLNVEAQKKVLSLFHHALNPDGHLLLGPSETLGPHSGLFAPVDKKWRLFKRLDAAGQPLKFPMQPPRMLSLEHLCPAEPKRRGGQNALQGVMEKALSEHYGRPSVLVDADLNVVRAHGDVNKFMEIPQGELSCNLYKLARKSLRLHIRSAVTKAVETGKSVEARNLRISSGQTGKASFNLIVDPLGGVEPKGLMLLIFEDSEPPEHERCEIVAETVSESAVVTQLEEELRASKESLRQVVDDFDAVNEELTSSNEELMSMNEELQSSYEELETSKEELQALNEELSLMNTELQMKVEELDESNGYLENLLRSTNVATIFLDRELRILRFTPAASELFNLIDTDLRRPITDITSSIPDLNIPDDARFVLETRQSLFREVRSTDGAWHQARLLPYFSPKREVEGTVLTLVDVTRLKEAQESLRIANDELEQRVRERTRDLAASEARFRATFEQAAVGIAQIAPDGAYMRVNDRYCEISGYSCEELRQRNSRDIIHPDDLDAAVEQARRLLAGEIETASMEKRYVRKDGSLAWVSLTRSLVRKDGGEPDYIINVVQDISARKRAEQRADSLSKFPEQNPYPVMRFDQDGTLLYANRAGAGMLERLGCQFGDASSTCPAFIRDAARHDELRSMETRVEDKTFLLTAAPVPEMGYVNVYGMEVTELKRTEAARRESEERFRTLLENAPDAIFVQTRGCFAYANPAAAALFGVAGSEELIGASVADAFHPDSANIVRDRIRQLNEKRTAVPLAEMRYLRRDGSPMDVDVSAAPIVYGGENGALVFMRDVAERRQAEKLLRESEELYRGIFLNEHSCMLLVDPETGAIVDANPAASAYYGYSREQLLSMRVSQINILPAEEIAALMAAASGKSQNRFELRHRLASGEVRDVEVASGPVMVKGRQLLYSIIQDITERKAAEEALRKSLQDIELIVEGTELGLWSNEWPLNRMNWSSRVKEHFWLPPDAEPNLDDFFACLHPDDRDPVREAIAQAVEHRGFFDATYRVVAPDGRTRWVRAAGRAIYGEDGQPTRFSGITQDVTARTRAENALRAAMDTAERRVRAQARLAKVARDLSTAHGLEQLMPVVCSAARDLADADGCTFVLRDGEQCFYADEDAIDPLWKGRRFPMETCISGWVMLHRQAVVIEDVFADPRIPADAYRPTFVKSLAMAPVRRDDPIAAIGSYWATPRRPDAEVVDVLQSLADLVSVAMENTQLYDQLRDRADELEQQKEAAEAANRAKNEFLANMSHEVRTPMNGILGMNELALMNETDPRIRQYLELAKKSGWALMSILNDILDFSKIEAGKVSLELEPFDLDDVLVSTTQPFAVSEAAEGLRLVLDISPEVPRILVGDHGRLRQVLTNLVSNAVKFSERGTVRISAAPLDGESETDHLRLLFTVADEGMGIPKDKLAMIFESFAQLRSSAHMKYGGTGLGLSISKQLVELMGGHIWVESEVGVGSTFSFTADFDVPKAAAPSREADASAQTFEGPLKILLAEDDTVNQLMAVKLLERMGHSVRLATTGVEVLEMLGKEPFDLVLMDVRMPKMDGEQAARLIRSGEVAGVNPEIPIIALTAYALKSDRERLLAAGMNDYLAKPVEVDEFKRVIGRVRRSGKMTEAN